MHFTSIEEAEERINVNADWVSYISAEDDPKVVYPAVADVTCFLYAVENYLLGLVTPETDAEEGMRILGQLDRVKALRRRVDAIHRILDAAKAKQSQ